MWDYILNKVSKYIKTPERGKEVDLPVESEEPKQLKLAKNYHGKHEVTNNKELKALLGFNPATTPWCAGFVNAIEKACGRRGTGQLLARSYLNYGMPVADYPRPGDIVVFTRGNSSWQGHVGYYVSEDAYNVLTLGGNQSNKVCYKYYPKKDVLGYRRPL